MTYTKLMQPKVYGQRGSEVVRKENTEKLENVYKASTIQYEYDV